MSSSSIVVITGAAKPSGLGYNTVKQLILSSTPYKVVLTSRTLQGSRNAAESLQKELGSFESGREVIPMEVDIDDDQSLNRFAKELKGKVDHVDTVINNAAGHFDFPLKGGKMTTREAYNKVCNTNIASTSLFTEAVAPLLVKSANPRLVFLSTGIASLGNQPTDALANSPPNGWPKEYTFNVMTYRSSKAGLNMMALEWARILKNDGVKVFCLDPGLLATELGGADMDMMKAGGAEDVSVGAKFVSSVAQGEWDGKEGRLIGKDGVQPW